MFVDELLAAYPNAKIILTERDIKSWEISMNNTIFKLLSWRSFYWIGPLEPVCTPSTYCIDQTRPSARTTTKPLTIEPCGPLLDCP